MSYLVPENSTNDFDSLSPLSQIETNTFDFRDGKLERFLSLTPADRKWIDDIVKDVNEGWNNDDPTRPAGMLYVFSIFVSTNGI